ncbi:hypothetical protein [Hymenobacter terricola]|uniref:hypothetical protein n=1 Tax=Hymenobacter terricola TaxID=2819236 RepID=UPI001B30F69D|nr:hypothetical protein [Hymenobacter terricola]
MITLPEVQRHRVGYQLRKKQIKVLQRLGFQLYDHKDKLILFLPFSISAEIPAVKYVLAKIAFEVFYFKDFSQDSYIKYHEPAVE